MAKDRIKQLWEEKYRPKSVKDVVFQSEQQKRNFLDYVKEKEFPHILMVGVQGTGKTTLSRALVADCGIDPSDVMSINASKDNNVDTMRDKISNFCEAYSSSKFKVVRLEEMDRLSPGAMGILRGIMEDYSDYVRFIGTANYANKIIPSIHSRFQTYTFKAPSYNDVAVLVAEMLVKENVDFEPTLLEKYIASYYPDIRKLVGSLNQYSKDGVLQEPESVTGGDYKFKMLDLMEAGNLRELRKLICENVTREEYEDVYRFMYENISKIKKFDGDQQESAIVLIADYLYKHAFMADPEINFHGLCIKLNSL